MNNFRLKVDMRNESRDREQRTISINIYQFISFLSLILPDERPTAVSLTGVLSLIIHNYYFITELYIKGRFQIIFSLCKSLVDDSSFTIKRSILGESPFRKGKKRPENFHDISRQNI